MEKSFKEQVEETGERLNKFVTDGYGGGVEGIVEGVRREYLEGFARLNDSDRSVARRHIETSAGK